MLESSRDDLIGRLLVISDLHGRSASSPVEKLAHCIHWNLERRGLLPVDVLICPGDFAHKNGELGYQWSLSLLDALSYHLPLPAGGVIFVPGNHDLAIPSPLARGSDRLPIPMAEAFERYSAFLTQVHSRFPGALAASGPHLSTFGRIHRRAGQPGVAFAGLNTCRMEWLGRRGHSYVGMDQLGAVLHRLNTIADEGDVFVSIGHHNLVSAAWNQPTHSDPPRFVDGVTVHEALAKIHCSLHIFGHTHRFMHDCIYRGGEGVWHIGVGTLGAADVEVRGYGFAPSQGFALIELRNSWNGIRCVEHLFQSRSNAFESGDGYWTYSNEELGGFDPGRMTEHLRGRRIQEISSSPDHGEALRLQSNWNKWVGVNCAHRGTTCAELEDLDLEIRAYGSVVCRSKFIASAAEAASHATNIQALMDQCPIELVLGLGK